MKYIIYIIIFISLIIVVWYWFKKIQYKDEPVKSVIIYATWNYHYKKAISPLP